jgi:hypothetical protein
MKDRRYGEARGLAADADRSPGEIVTFLGASESRPAGDLELVSSTANNGLRAGAAAIVLSPPPAFGQPHRPNARPRLPKSLRTLEPTSPLIGPTLPEPLGCARLLRGGSREGDPACSRRSFGGVPQEGTANSAQSGRNHIPVTDSRCFRCARRAGEGSAGTPR